jgi:hypothetical protein
LVPLAHREQLVSQEQLEQVSQAQLVQAQLEQLAHKEPRVLLEQALPVLLALSEPQDLQVDLLGPQVLQDLQVPLV